MTTVNSIQADNRAAIKRLGVGFIKKLKTARSTIHEMKKMADKHGKCVRPCEIPSIATYLEGVENQLDWYLTNLHESQEGRKG